MILSPLFRPTLFGDDIVLRSLPDHLEDYWPQQVRTGKDKHEIYFNVQEYGPNNIKVKTSGGFLVVEGNHEEKRDEHGYISRQFTRRFVLPEGCDLEKVESRVTPDGMLIITVPRKEVGAKDTVIPVTHETIRTKSKL